MPKAIPILCIVGSSGSGKTTLMESLIRELSQRGCRVATIKHTHHAVELDQPGKDSWRHRQAGATISVVCSRKVVAAFSDVKRELTVEELRIRFIHDVDVILVEGYKDSDYPKIVVVDSGTWNATGWRGVRAIVSDQPLEAPVPVFGRDDLAGIVAFLERAFLNRRKIKSRNLLKNRLESKFVLSD